MTKVCADCPFLRWRDEDLAEKRDYVDRGGWVACQVSTPEWTSPTVVGRQAQMREEIECAGARIWRRDRRRPESGT